MALFAQPGIAQKSCEDARFRWSEADYGRIDLSMRQSVLNVSDATFGSLSALSRYPRSDVYRQRGEPVARLDVVMSNRCMQTCTATLLPGGHILTAAHCLKIPEAGLEAVKARAVFDHLSVRDSEADITTADVDIRSVRFLEPVKQGSVTLKVDVAIARLERTPERRPAYLSDTIPEDGASLYIISHPLGYPKMIALAGCALEGKKDLRLFHRCDTLGGSSGAAVFDTSSNQIIGVHTGGGVRDQSDNSGWLIAGAADQIRRLYANAFFAPSGGERSPAVSLPSAEAGGPPKGPVGLPDAVRLFEARDWGAARAAFERLAERDDATASAYLARIHAEGLGVPRDDARALALYRIAAGAGDAVALHGLGKAYQRGRGVVADEGLAQEHFLASARAGYAPAQYERALFHERRLHPDDPDLSAESEAFLNWLRLSADQGYAPALDKIYLELSYLAADAPSGDERSALEREAFSYLEKALPIGRPETLLALGVAYRTGRGVTRNGTAARDAFERALSLGYDAAGVMLGDLYLTGGEGVPQDQDLGRRTLERVAANPGARALLGRIYARGLGVDRNYRRAIEHYLAAIRAQAQPAEVYFEMAEIYLEGGSGVGRSRPSAMQWMLYGIETTFYRLIGRDAGAAEVSAALRPWLDRSDRLFDDLSPAEWTEALRRACQQQSQYGGLVGPGAFATCPGAAPMQPGGVRYDLRRPG
jgi:TPR repeat protein